MDIRTGATYHSRAEAEAALRAQGVPDEEIKRRVVSTRTMKPATRLALVRHVSVPKNKRRRLRQRAAAGG